MGSRTTSRSTKSETSGTTVKTTARTRKPTAAKVTSPAVAAKPTVTRGSRRPNVPADERQRYVAEAAYYIALQRGFADDRQLDDWLQAEAQIERLLDAEVTH